jgi:hypothetical protein
MRRWWLLTLLQELPLMAWYPFDVRQPGNYLLVFTFQLIILIAGPMVNIGTDTFLMSLMIHACGEFLVLKKSLRNLTQRVTQLQDEDIIFRSRYPPQRFVLETKYNNLPLQLSASVSRIL